jgi:hypothetical protein
MKLWLTAILSCIAIGFYLPAHSLAQDAEKIPVTFYGAARGAPASLEKAPASEFFGASAGKYLKGYFKDVYPAIDMACYSDELSTEYVFIVHPGGDPSLIRFSCGSGFKAEARPDTTAVTLHSNRRELTFSQPVAVLHKDNKERSVLCRFNMITPSDFAMDASAGMALMSENLNGTLFNKIPKGGQPSGPDYDFYLARLEISTEQYLNFLNDAEANSMNSRGANLVFDKAGNVWVSADRQPGRDEMFTISQSRLEYLPEKAAGRRYQLRGGKKGTSRASHPITGISWYGAVKYCNWLTLIAERGASELCFREGTNHLSWAPAAATNWTQGAFSNDDRAAWIKFKGFRMPMVGTNSLVLEANRYNELYKAAVWNGHTNLAYGFGRDKFEGSDANFMDMSTTLADTLPAGFFAPTNVLINQNFRPSQNAYGIFDLSGNVSEWTADPYGKDLMKGMLTFGGSWADKHTPASQCRVIPPHTTQASGGFRPLTTFMPAYMMEIHFLVTFFDLPQEYVTPPEPPFIQDGTQIEPSAPEEPTSLLVPTEGPPVKALPPPIDPDRDNPTGLTVIPPEGGIPGPVSPPVVGGGGGRPPFIHIGPSGPGGPGGPVGPPSTNLFLTVNSTPASGVAITCTPDFAGAGNGITAFTREYVTNAPVTLVAPAAAGLSAFSHWERNGVFLSNNQSESITMSANITMTAVYAPYPRLQVQSTPASGVPIICTVDVQANGNGNTAFTRYYATNAPVTLVAPAANGLTAFSHWERNGVFLSANLSESFIMSSDITMTAVYVPYMTLQIESTPFTNVAVTCTPDAQTNGNGNTAFTRYYTTNAPVTLTAPPNAGVYVFSYWDRNGALLSTNMSVSITMSTDTTMTAVYVPPLTTLRVFSLPASNVAITATQDFYTNGNGNTTFTRYYILTTPVTLTAPPTAGINTFTRWELDGALLTTNYTANFVMNTNRDAVAIYVFVPGPIDPPDPSPSGL